MWSRCWVHLSRTVARYIRNKDRKNVLDDLKSVYRTTSENEARKALAEFLAKYGKRYPKLAGIFERAEESLYPFTNFRRQAEKAFTLQIWLRGATKVWSISPRPKSSFLMKMHLIASYAVITVIWTVPILSGCNVASVKPPPKYYNCLKTGFKPPINKM